jgi:tRNA (guanine-N7-)-methyltransferase
VSSDPSEEDAVPRYLEVCTGDGGVDGEALHSFKRRGGRVTPGQRRALDTLLPVFGVPVTAGGVDRVAVFGRHAPLVLEIGFGMGEATVAMAAADPGRDVLAVDVHVAGVGALLREVEALGLRNVRVVVGDAVEVLHRMLGPGSLDEVRVFFPDPWPKARHHKRRLVGTTFAGLVGDRLASGGRLHCATDWAPYAEQMLAVVADEPRLVNDHGGFAPRPARRPVTRFEQQGLARGHQVFDVIARRV